MPFELRPGDGSLFPEKDRKSDKHPNLTGKIVTPDGNTWLLAAWTKEGQNGKFLSLKATSFEAREEKPKEPEPPPPTDDDIPGF